MIDSERVLTRLSMPYGFAASARLHDSQVSMNEFCEGQLGAHLRGNSERCYCSDLKDFRVSVTQLEYKSENN